MRWQWGFGVKVKEQGKTSQAKGCPHPIGHQVNLHEDPSNRSKTTGMKCTRCGQRI